MARTRPIKLHIKDGKDATFRLIGPRGRVLNMLKWDGDGLDLADASDVEDISMNDDNVNEDSVSEQPDIIARNKKGETEEEAVERVQEDHPDKTVEFENPDTPPLAAEEDDGLQLETILDNEEPSDESVEDQS